MYICVCTAVTEQDISASIAAGASSYEEVQFATGLGTCCGQCSEYAREHVAQACAAPCGTGSCAAACHDEQRLYSRRAPLVPLARAA